MRKDEFQILLDLQNGSKEHRRIFRSDRKDFIQQLLVENHVDETSFGLVSNQVLAALLEMVSKPYVLQEIESTDITLDDLLRMITEEVVLIYKISGIKIEEIPDERSAVSEVWGVFKKRYDAQIFSDTIRYLTRKNLAEENAQSIVDKILLSLANLFYKSQFFPLSGPVNAIDLEWWNDEIRIESSYWEKYLEDQINLIVFRGTEKSIDNNLRNKILNFVRKKISVINMLEKEAHIEDIVSETVIRLLIKLRDPTTILTSQLSTLALSIANNVILEQLRNWKKNGWTMVELSEANDIEYVEPVDTMYRELVDNARKKLNPIYAEIIHLRFDQGLSHEKIGAHCGLTANASATRLERAKRSLRALVCGEAKEQDIQLFMCNER